MAPILFFKYISSTDKEEWGNREMNKWKKKRGLIMKDPNSAITTYSNSHSGLEPV